MKRIIVLLLFIVTFFNGSCKKKSLEKKSLGELKNSDYHSLTKTEVQKIFRSIETDKLPKKRYLYASHYPSSNERRIDLFMPYIKDLRGGYIGVGTDQNFSFIAWAKSEFAWLIDFDIISVAVNRIHIFFISIAPTAKDFRILWSRSHRKSSFKLVKKHFKPKKGDAKSKRDYKIILRAWKIAHYGCCDVPARFKDLDYMIKHFKLRTFVNNENDYRYLHKMVLENRIVALPGDLTKDKTILSIARAAKKLKIPIRVFYMSNAEEYFHFPQKFRNNILALPTDEKGIIVRTSSKSTSRFGYPKGEKYPKYPLHYSIQPLRNMKSWMKFRSPLKVKVLLKYRTPVKRGFSIINKTPAEAGLKEKGRI